MGNAGGRPGEVTGAAGGGRSGAVSVGTAAEVAEAVRAHARVAATGGGTKPGLFPSAEGVTRIDLAGLDGVVAYDPAEFTFTAAAGTPLRDVRQMLAARGQYLPFDPPLAERGATLGGAVAAGFGGSGRYRYGGVRDFLIGVRFVDGRGELVRGGGAVVKNAAGFDLPKLMVGAAGRLGILTELTLKVFPAPRALTTLRVGFADLGSAVAAMTRLARSPLDPDALDLAPADGGTTLWVRLGGTAEALPGRADRVLAALATHPPLEVERFGPEHPAPHWQEMDGLGWAGDGLLVRIPVTPRRILDLDAALGAAGAVRRYSAGGNSAWVGWSGTVQRLGCLLRDLDLAATCVRGPAPGPWLGRVPGAEFLRRIARALDPEQKFGALADLPA
jgi:glycolate oxidase FAD binding subunit